MIRVILSISIFLSVQVAQAQVDLEKLLHHPWVDSVFASLSTEQRIAQLVWIDVTAKNNLEKQLKDAELIKTFGLGGIIYFEGDPFTQAKLTNYYQSLSKTPLLSV